MSFILPTLHRQAAKEVGVQTESFHAPTFPEARSGERVLHLRVSESTDLLGSAQCHRLPGGWEGLIAVSEALQMRGGCVQVLPLSETRLVKLQVFFDLSDTLTEQRPGHAPWALLPVTYETVRSERALERWYIGQAMSASPAYHAFASVLRHTESYGLVRFLLEQGTRSEKLSDLAQRYGVSVSHFRRLCRQALGSAAKPALRGWRTAQALLNMSLRDCSLIRRRVTSRWRLIHQHSLHRRVFQHSHWGRPGKWLLACSG